MMKKLLVYVMMGGAALLSLNSCKQEKTASAVDNLAQSDSLQKIIDQKDNEINDMMGTLNEIQEGFREINEAEHRVSIVKDGEGSNKSQQIRENIKFISNAMKRNRELIARLQSQLRESSVHGEQFKTTIDNLVKQLNDKDTQLKQLRAEHDANHIHISELD